MSGGTTVGALHDYDEVMDGSMKFAGRDNQDHFGAGMGISSTLAKEGGHLDTAPKLAPLKVAPPPLTPPAVDVAFPEQNVKLMDVKKAPGSPAGDAPGEPDEDDEPTLDETSPFTDPMALQRHAAKVLSIYATTYKTAFLPPMAPLPCRKLRTASGFNSNFQSRFKFLGREKADIFSSKGSSASAGKVPPRRIRTAPAVGGAYMRARLNQIKELTGYQENFGPNVASFVNEEHVSMATTSGLHQAPLGETSQQAEHGFEALVYEEKPVLARSWLYQPSGYVWNGVDNRFDDPDATGPTVSTTTSAFPVKPLQRPTPPKIGAKKGAYDGGYNKGLWTTRVTFQKGDLNPLPRMSQEPQRGFLSETREQQLLAADMRRQSATRELPKIDLDPLSTARRLLSASTKTDLKTAPARPEAPKTGYAQNWSGNGSILGGSTVPLPSSRYTPLDTLTETADKYIPPVTVKRGGSGSANDSAFSLTNTWVGSAATPVKTGNSAYSPREVGSASLTESAYQRVEKVNPIIAPPL